MGFIDQLHAVHADVVTRRPRFVAIIGVNGVNRSEGDEPPVAGGGATGGGPPRWSPNSR